MKKNQRGLGTPDLIDIQSFDRINTSMRVAFDQSGYCHAVDSAGRADIVDGQRATTNGRAQPAQRFVIMSRPAWVMNVEVGEEKSMKPILFGLALALGILIASPSAAQQAQAPPSEPAHKIFVLTGCLAGSPAETAPFKLTGAVPVGQAPPERSTTSADGKDVYELLPTSALTEQGVGRAQMQTHVGKKVEVTVRPLEVSAPRPSSSSSTAAAAKPEEASPQRYTVTEIKSLAGSCLQK